MIEEDVEEIASCRCLWIDGGVSRNVLVSD